MWMTNTEFELGIALAVVALYLLTYDRVLNKYERDGGFSPGPSQAQAQEARVYLGLRSGRSHNARRIADHNESHRA